MRRKWFYVIAPLAGMAFVALCSVVVMYLWNWLLPALFGWKLIGFWQALGLLVLCRMLFGGFGGGHGPGRSKARRAMAERWAQMTPEERAAFHQSMHTRCGAGRTPQPTETGSPA